ncbi:MAG TPA: carbon-nitrogen family hydrolase [Firmicutes bacterium]|nr:omega-amidase [Bacillota bacterium]HHV56590.1 carbon-nitrogen family hydrolase [Bacillota bacterium]
MSQLRVSVIQMQVELGEKERNLAHAAELIARAAKDEPDVLLLPETFNVGFFPTDLAAHADAAEEGESRQLLSRLAREHRVNIVGGSVVRFGPDGEVRNTTYVFNRVGQEVARYDKIHLFSPSGEKDRFAAGTTPSLFTLEGISLASIICYDLRFPELVRGLALAGAQVLFVPAEWPHPRVEHWRTLLRARAIENQFFVVACNACGPVGNLVNSGHSAVIDPWGEVLVEAGEEEVILSVNLNLDSVAEVRRRIAVFADRRPEVYAPAPQCK